MKQIFMTCLVTALAAQAMAQAPTVTTDTRFARGATVAYGRATFKYNGSPITKRGFCWSADSKEPTIDDNVSKKILTNNGQIFCMTDLQPATKYYARAYAVAADGSVGYGNVIKIVTLPKGTITWQYDNGGDAAANERINAAVGSCVDYWNNHTSITGLNLNVHYGADTPTADCSYGGWMRVGPNSSYQRTGTIIHEALHAIGVGTHTVWNGSGTPLRGGNGTGQWLGDRATDLIHFWDDNNTTIVNGDQTHIWPYGINGAHEDNGTEVLYTITSLLAQAVGEDGLPATGAHSFGTPYYSFDQEDNVKYYIKSESETYGLYNSFLVEDANHNLKWKTMTSAEAEKNDAAAWYVTFTPDNQYYQLRNAATGYYITYSATGVNGIKTVSRTTPTDAENFQLMRSRIDIKTSSGTVVTPQRGYWVIHPDNGTQTPPCLAGYSGGSVTTQKLDLSDNKQAQRWLILTKEEASRLDNSALIVAKDEFNKNKSLIESWMNTPHKEVVAGADATMNATLSDLSSKCNASTTPSDVQGYATELLTSGKTYLSQVQIADKDQLFDLTPLMKNPSFEGATTGWFIGTGGTHNYGEIEFYQKVVVAYQIVKSMPKGTYKVKVQGFQRPGSYTDVYSDYANGTDKVAVNLYVNEKSYGSTLLKNIMAERSKTSYNGGDKAMTDGTYIPNNMASAAAHFAKGDYDNELTVYIPTDGNVTINLRGANGDASYWTCFDNFRLYYLGAATLDDITATPVVVEANKEPQSTAVYTIDGRATGKTLQELPAGIYIQNNKKIVKH